MSTNKNISKEVLLLAQGNLALRDRNYQLAINLFEKALLETPSLSKIIERNIQISKRLLRLKSLFFILVLY